MARPASSRESTGLASVHTRWGATSCRKAAPFTYRLWRLVWRGVHRDKEGRKEAKEQGSKVPWGEEVLVSKAEHEEAKSHMQDLESQVGQLGKQVEMQLHLKELEAKARIEVRVPFARFAERESRERREPASETDVMVLCLGITP